MHARLVFAASPSLTLHAPIQARTHARKDCFGSRRLCRGNANSHARGNIHNTMPLITHCLCNSAILLIPSSPFSISPFLYRLARSPRHVIRIRANRNKIRNASVLTTRGVIICVASLLFFHPPYYDFLPAGEIGVSFLYGTPETRTDSTEVHT